MANKTEKLDLKTIKPGAADEFNPTYRVENVEARGKKDGDYIHARLVPHGGGASTVGALVFRMPAVLAPGQPLWAFATLVGQDPKKGFDLEACTDKIINVSFTPGS